MGGGGGGVLNALTGERAPGASFQSQVNAALKKTRREPRNPAMAPSAQPTRPAKANTTQAGEQYTGKTGTLNKVARRGRLPRLEGATPAPNWPGW